MNISPALAALLLFCFFVLLLLVATPELRLPTVLQDGRTSTTETAAHPIMIDRLSIQRGVCDKATGDLQVACAKAGRVDMKAVLDEATDDLAREQAKLDDLKRRMD